MSAKKNQTILNFFSRKPTSSPGGSNSPSQTQPKKLVSTITKPQKTNEEGDQKPKDDSLNKSQEDLELDELAKSCLEDDDDDDGMDVSEPKVEKKKRKRISLLEDSSDDEENHSKKDDDTPNKRCKLNEVNENKPSSMSTPRVWIF